MLLLTLLASTLLSSGFNIKLTSPSEYLGRGDETGIKGIDADAEVYREQVRFVFSLEEHGVTGDDVAVSARVQQLFEQVARDYTYYHHVSPLIREAWGHRTDDGAPQISPMGFIAKLAEEKTGRGRHLLTDRRVRELTVDLADNYPTRVGALSGCAGEVRRWLVGLVDGAPDPSDPAAVRAALLETDGGAIRARMATVDSSGCERSGPRDYLYISYGVSYGVDVAAEGSWFVIEYDYSDRAPGRRERVIPYEKIAGPSRYFRGEYKLTIDPSAGELTVIGGYDIDLSLWPERIVTSAHEQFLVDFVSVLYERWTSDGPQPEASGG